MSLALTSPDELLEGAATMLREVVFDSESAGAAWTSVEPPATLDIAGLELVTVDLKGRVIAALPIVFSSRVQSGSQIRLVGADPGGVLVIRAGVDIPSSHLTTNLRVRTDGRSAASVFPVLRFLSTAVGFARLGFRRDGALVGSPMPLPKNADTIGLEVVEVMRSLAFVEDALNDSREVPLELTATDKAALTAAETLLRGGVFRGRWSTVRIPRDELGADGVALLEDSATRLDFRSVAVQTVAGRQFTLGDAYFVFESLEHDAEGSDSDTIALRAAKFSDEYTIQLVNPPPKKLADPYRPFIHIGKDVLDEARGKRARHA
jgi:hypothetical protein